VRVPLVVIRAYVAGYALRTRSNTDARVLILAVGPAAVVPARTRYILLICSPPRHRTHRTLRRVD